GIDVARLPFQVWGASAKIGPVFARAARELKDPTRQRQARTQDLENRIPIARYRRRRAASIVWGQGIEVVDGTVSRHDASSFRGEEQLISESIVLIAGNRNTSSWSLRAWLALRKSG